ncbi:MAG: DUF2723 domain-containing protein [Anaerolineae bacterium]|nr:DUF2723 domain-containing protein [Anaerolineae bacterium]
MSAQSEKPARSRRLTRADAWLAPLAGGGALLLYARTLAPGLLPYDSGEMQVLTYLLGNTHPTGYQVYLLLANLFARLPTGGLAYRVNLFSAVSAALAVAGVYLSGRLMGGGRWAALFGALAFIEQKPHREGEHSESSVIAYVEAHIGEHPVYWTDCLPELRAAGYECQPRLVGPTTLYRVLPAER